LISGIEDRWRGGIIGEKGRRRDVGRIGRWVERNVRGSDERVRDGGEDRYLSIRSMSSGGRVGSGILWWHAR